MKLTPKRDLFAQKFIELSNASAAYREAYSTENMKPETIWSEAYKLLKNPHVAARIDELRALLAARHVVTVESLTENLAVDRALAHEIKRPSAAVTATMGMAKLHGHLHKKAPLPTAPPSAPGRKLSDLELAKRMAFILERGRRQLEKEEKGEMPVGADAKHIVGSTPTLSTTDSTTIMSPTSEKDR